MADIFAEDLESEFLPNTASDAALNKKYDDVIPIVTLKELKN